MKTLPKRNRGHGNSFEMDDFDGGNHGNRREAAYDQRMTGNSEDVSESESEEEWSYCWNCDAPVRAHWETCPSLGCGVSLQRDSNDDEHAENQPRRSNSSRKSTATHSEASDDSFFPPKTATSDYGKFKPKASSFQRPDDDMIQSDDDHHSDYDAKDSYEDQPKPRRTSSLLHGKVNNAGAESLGAVKMPDWMKLTEVKKDFIAESSDTDMRVHMNAAELNEQEASNAKKKKRAISGNSVITAKYTFYSFLFVNLYQQFSRFANIYFLIIAALQLLTPLSPTGRYSTAAPLALVLAANMVREIWEDSKRHKDDHEVNHRVIEVIRGGRVEEELWKNLKVGDIVWVKKGSEFPADLVQLASSDEAGGSYIDTCNLDGETNLKIKSSLSLTQDARNHSQISKARGLFEYEPPNKRLYTFIGKVTIDGQTIPVDNDVVLLRGAVLRNTKWIYGIVVYAGKQTKLLMNARAAQLKMSNVERLTNRILGAVLLFEIIMCSLGCIGNAIWAKGNKDTWYMPYLQSQSTAEILSSWITYFILLNNYLPISLYVSMELAKLGQKILIDNDIEMYHAKSDTPALARTSNLNEELGQIEYIFSDKTGTLTRNEMEFRKCFIVNTSYGFGTTEIGASIAQRSKGEKKKDPAEADADATIAQFNYDPSFAFDDVRIRKRLESRHPDSRAIRDFFRNLSVSHTVVPEGEAQPNKIKYQAESPDEGALVSAAKCLGFFYCEKTAKTHTIDVFGDRETYEILNINKFNSTRKRMSCVVKTPENKLMLYIKGADNVMLDRLAPGQPYVEETAEMLKVYAQEGLRTLVIGQREISEHEWREWDLVFRHAASSLVDREDKLMEAAEMIERNITLVGATAIEDKLQIGVPDAISTLAMAGIKIWVLTGDKQETAENIGFACNLIKEDMKRIYLLEGDEESIKRRVIQEMEEMKKVADKEYCLIVDGKALLEIMRAQEEKQSNPDSLDLMLSFLDLAKKCKAVVACRVSPDQKRQIVYMVKHNVKPVPMTLAIGDGANDVPMILEASVGIGISGNEGMQAVRSSDYAIAQFRFLKRLLLVHGRSNYKRVSIVVMYSLYKNCTLVSTLFAFGTYSGWTGTALFDALMLAGFNVGWAFFGVIIFGTIENDVSPAAAIAYPQLYQSGQQQRDFNMRVLLRWFLTGIYHTVICFFVASAIFMNMTVKPTWAEDGHVVFGTIVEQAIIAVVNIKLLIETNYLTNYSLFSYILGWLLFVLGGLIHSLWAMSSFFTQIPYEYYDIHPVLLWSIVGWFTQLLTIVIAMIPELSLKYILRTYFPQPGDIVKELDNGHGGGLSAHSVVAEWAGDLPASEMGEEDKKKPLGVKKMDVRVVKKSNV